MSDFVVEPSAVAGAAQTIASSGQRIAGLSLGSSFGELSGAFAGATDPMRAAAAQGDQVVESALSNAGDHVQGWSELVMGFKGTAEEMDENNSAMIRQAVALPSERVCDPHNED
jgi:type IV secretory pathway TrbL component